MKPGNMKDVEEMFNLISPKYDFLNDIFSFGLHRIWKRKLLNILNPTFGEEWVDLCCGTGEMSILLLILSEITCPIRLNQYQYIYL